MTNPNTQNLKPVSDIEVMIRINEKLEGTGFSMILFTPRSDTPESAKHTVKMYLAGGFVTEFPCLDTLAMKLDVLADGEFLCWIEEAKAA